MKHPTRAFSRVEISNGDGTTREDRFFVTPSKTITRASYADENAPDSHPVEKPCEIAMNEYEMTLRLSGVPIDDIPMRDEL